MKIIFMGTPLFARIALERLIASNYEVIAIYTKPPTFSGRNYKENLSPVHLLGNKHNINVYTPHSFKEQGRVEEFQELGADIAVVAAYGLILPQKILDIPRHGCINIHPSLLPRWRGAAPIQRTIMSGDKNTAVCIMQMDAGLDTGDVLMKEEMAVPEDINFGGLHDLLAIKGSELLVKTIDNIGDLPHEVQSNIGVTYANKIDKKEELIDFNMDVREVYDLIRGLSPSPCGYFFIEEGVRVKIHQASYEIADHSYPYGSIIDSQKLSIACANGVLYPEILQKAGKNKMNVDEFLRGM